MNFRVKVLTIVGLLLMVFAPAWGDTISFTGTNSTGTPLSATAVFSASGGTLTITLTNNNAAKDPASVLIALFFDMAGSPTLTYASGNVAAGSSLFGVTSGMSTDVKANGEWKFASGSLSGVTQHYGVGTAGLGIFGGGGGQQFNYGLINGATADANPQIKSAASKGNTFIDDTIILTFTGLPTNYSVQEGISNIRFQYGTALSEPFTPGVPQVPVPEPSSVMLLGSGVAGVAGMLRRKLRR